MIRNNGVRLACRSIVHTGMAMMFAVAAIASETDQYYQRSEPLADSSQALNQKVNETLAEIVAQWEKGPDRKAFVGDVFDRLGGYGLVDELERWAVKSPQVEKRQMSKSDSIYGGLPPWAIRTVAFSDLGKTVRINDQLIGLDKISHFLSQGRKFYRRFLQYGSVEKASKHSVYTERAIFGSRSTGSFSNADLVANYEGHLFYRSLFEDHAVPGKVAILRWEGDHWVVQREFDWADHVNEYWDEALNINRFDRLLYTHMRRKLTILCPQYWESPALYTIENEEVLKARYAKLGLRESRHLRLDTLCLTEPPPGNEGLYVSAEKIVVRSERF